MTIEKAQRILGSNARAAVSKDMNAHEFKDRTKAFGLKIFKLVPELPNTVSCRIIRGALLRAGSSVGANYRAACRARSRADFVGKMKIAEEECDESIYWLEFLVDAGLLGVESAASLMKGRQRNSFFACRLDKDRPLCQWLTIHY